MPNSLEKWLDQNDLSQYLANFVENDISFDQLPEISDSDLLLIGVDSLGQRKRLLSAVKSQLQAPQQFPSSTAVSDVTELRQLTVLFCDLADSTELAHQLEPECLRHVIKAYQSRAAEIIIRYGGYVAQYLGDGLMVYFGFPTAHEDDAIRAAHTALELPEAIDELNEEITKKFNVTLSIRIGISTSDVIMGQIGTESNGDVLATGTAPNEAAHLQRLATSNSNVIGQQTRELLGDHFSFEVVSGNEHIATDGSQTKYRITGVLNAESRFIASRSYRKTDMLGRDEQLKLLQSRWSSATAKDSSTVLVSGEAGIGKSRLVQAVIDSVDNESHYRFIYQCSPFHVDTPLYPAIRQLLFTAQIQESDSDAIKVEKIESVVPLSVSGRAKSVALLARLIGVSAEKTVDPALTELSAKELREETMQLLIAMIISLSEERPVLIVVEDIHWIDPTTQTLIELTAKQISGRRILFLLTARSEYDFDWIDNPKDNVIELKRLSQKLIKKVVNQLSDKTLIPELLMTQIVSRTDGVPLFIEELTKTLLDSDLLRGNQDDLLGRDFSVLEIPATLQDSLMARLDKLNAVKKVAQIASCIGRDFSFTDVAALLPDTTAQIERSIGQLVAVELVIEERALSDVIYSFKHALVRDAAYASLPSSRKKIIHAALYRHYKTVNSSHEILGFHANAALLFDNAVHHWDSAAASAFKRAAFSEAIAHLEKAINCTHEMENSAATRSKELDLLVRQGHASTALHGFAHPSTVSINAKARELLYKVKESPLRFPVLYGHWVIRHAIGQHTTALLDSSEMYEESKQSGDRVQHIIASRALGSTQTMMGQFQSASNHFARALAAYESEEDTRLAWQYNLDPTVPCRIYSALCFVCMGEKERALKIVEPVESFANDLDHPHTKIYALSHLALTSQVGRWASRERYIELTIDFVDKFDLMAYRGHALGIKAMMLYEKGELEESRKTMQESLAVIAKTKTHIYSPLLYANYAACQADLGDIEGAGASVNTALYLLKDDSELWAKAEILRLLAHVEWTANQDRGAQLCLLKEAVETAEKQGARMWNLRASTSLALLHQELGDIAEAKALLQSKIEKISHTAKSSCDWQMADRLLTELVSP